METMTLVNICLALSFIVILLFEGHAIFNKHGPDDSFLIHCASGMQLAGAGYFFFNPAFGGTLFIVGRAIFIARLHWRLR